MKLLQQSLRVTFGALLVLMLATACSGGGGGHDDPADGSTPPGNGDNGGGAKTTCVQQFNPDQAAAGDDCTPTYNQACPTVTTAPIPGTANSIDECDGVAISNGSVTANGLSSDYVVLSPTSAAKAGGLGNALVVALHGAYSNGTKMAHYMRMSELAKTRNVTVVLPTAPQGTLIPGLPAPAIPGIPRTWGTSSAISPSASKTDLYALVDAVIAQVQGPAKAGTPVYLVGVSGGAVLTFQYACDHAGAISGVELVAAELNDNYLAACKPTQAIATVQVHGTKDNLGPYAQAQAAFTLLLANNGCVDTDVHHTALPVPSGEAIDGIDVAYAKAGCSTGKGNALVTIDGGGHSWPGVNRDADVLPVDLFGPVTNGFDATLQGYDLLNYLKN